jgi:hypothetical protein
MMKNLKILAICLVFMLSACGSGKNSTPSQDPNAIYTSAAETVSVQLTQNAARQPSETATSTATNTETPTVQQITTVVANTATTVPTSTITLPAVQDRVEFLSQNPSDGVVLSPNSEFTVTWEIRNVGQTTWTTGYSIRFFSGDRIGAGLAGAYTFTKEVPPGETYSVTAKFNTGSQLGIFQSNWVLTNADGNNFYPLYISIKVDNPTATPTATETTIPTETPTETEVSAP